jgi:hypothetical protein
MLPLLVKESQPGGWVVIQDDSGGVTTPQWTALMARYVAAIPDDRCILAIIPGVGKVNTLAPGVQPVVITNARAMRGEIRKQPCYAFIRWDLAVNGHPDFVVEDGTHPTTAGKAWLAAAIDNAVGFRG